MNAYFSNSTSNRGTPIAVDDMQNSSNGDAALVHLLAERRIGAVSVLDSGEVIGVFSERDVVRALAGVEVTEMVRFPEPLAPNLSARRARMTPPSKEELWDWIAGLDAPGRVVLVEGAGDDADARLLEGQRVYRKLAEHLPPSTAAKLAADLTGAPRKALYGGGAQD